MKTESCLNQMSPEFESIEAHWSYCSFPQFIFSLSLLSFLLFFLGFVHGYYLHSPEHYTTLSFPYSLQPEIKTFFYLSNPKTPHMLSSTK